MKKILLVLALSLFGVGMAGAQGTAKETESTDPRVKRGKYVAQAANCIACHSFDKGPYSGGTPFGIVFSPNITPDKETGIGTYSFKDFEGAVRQGISPKGYSLFSLMPPSYSIMTDADIHDLYEFFMNGIPAVKNSVKKTDTARTNSQPRQVVPFTPGAEEDPLGFANK